MSDEKSVFLKEGSVSLVGSLFDKALRYVFLAAVTYLVLPDTYGMFVFVISTLSLIYGFINLNLHRSISYFVPRFMKEGEQDQATGFIRRVGFAMLLVGGVSGVSVLVLAPYIASIAGNPDSAFLFAALAILIPIYAVRDVFREVFRSFERVRYIVLTQSVLFPVTQLVVTVGALASTTAIVALVIGITAAWVVALLTSVFLLWRLPIQFDKARTPDVSWNKLLDYSLPLLGAGIIGSVLTQIDLLLLGVLSTDANVAFFKIAFSVAALAKLAPQMFKSISKPLFAKVDINSDTSSISEFYMTTARWGALATIPTAIFLLVEYEPLVAVLFSDEYSTAALAVPIIVGGNAFATFFGYHEMLLEATNHTRVLLVQGIIALVVNLLLDILLIPELGIVGAAIGTSVALTAGTIIQLAATVRFEIHRMPANWYHVKYLVVGATVGVIIFIIPTVISPVVSLLLDGIILAILYPAGCVLIGGLTEEDVTIIERGVNKLERASGLRVGFMVRLAEYGARDRSNPAFPPEE